MRRRREALAADRGALLELLRAGSRRARERAVETMDRVRAAMRLDYDRLVRPQ